jgi:hypothetical protein
MRNDSPVQSSCIVPFQSSRMLIKIAHTTHADVRQTEERQGIAKESRPSTTVEVLTSCSNECSAISPGQLILVSSYKTAQ